MKLPRMKKPNSATDQRTLTSLKKIKASRVNEVVETLGRSDDKLHAVIAEKCVRGKCTTKLIRFSSAKSIDQRYRSKKAMRSFLARHNCSTAKDPHTARFWACHSGWNPNLPLRAMGNCPTCSRSIRKK